MREINMSSIRAIDRAIDVLEAFTLNKSTLTIEELSQLSKLPKNTAYRILYTLERRGLIQYDPETLTYSPGLRLIEFGLLKTSMLDVHQEAEPFLNELHLQTNQTVLMAVRENQGQVFYSLKKENESYEGLKVTAHVGVRRPFLYGVLGPVLLAYQPDEIIERVLSEPIEQITPFTVTDKELVRQRLLQIRKDRFFVELNETDIGVIGMSAPIFGLDGQAIAAIGVVGPEIQLNDRLEEIKQLIQSTAEKISSRMGYRPAE